MASNIIRTDITERLNKIFMNRFEIDLFDSEKSYDMDDNLFDKRFKLRERDLLYLVFDLEHEFGITITEEDVDHIKLNTIRRILTVIQKEMQAA